MSRYGITVALRVWAMPVLLSLLLSAHATADDLETNTEGLEPPLAIGDTAPPVSTNLTVELELGVLRGRARE